MTLELSKNGEVKLEAINKILEQSVNKIRTSKDFIESISSRFKGTSFYKWREVRYFLYEYELSLKEKSKSKRIKIDWNVYSSDKDDFITIEHIYPQKPKDTSWTSIFKYHHTQNDKLCHSLGNLLPLSKPKNSSLQNIPFLKKVDNDKDKVGYRYGSLSENEISKYKDWTPQHVLDRGIHLLEFLEKRWNVNLGIYQKKVDILGLSFMLK